VPAIVGRGAPWQGLETHGCGWWIDNSVAAIADCLGTALAKPPEELRAMGRRGRRWVVAEFGWPRVAEQMRVVYRWLIEGGSPPDTVRLD
jgi:glycosyltransferase involved in cell wall biosynthesis